MKNPFITAASALLIACMAYSGANAQTYVPPSLTDILWTSTSTNEINGINTALIDYPVGMQLYAQLAACAHGGVPGTGTPLNGVEVTDVTYGTTVSVPYPAGLYDMASVPDVALGNNRAAVDPTREFIMAVTFVNNNVPADIEIDYFDIVITTPGTFTVTYNSSEYLPYVGGFTTPLGTVHIDVVAESDNTRLYSLPLCDKFFVTFDADWGGTYDVFGAYGSLSGYGTTIGPVDITDTSFHYVDNWQPDVTGVQQKTALGPADVGIFTWVNQCNCAIYTVSWDPNAGTLFNAVTLSPVSLSTPFSYPRIDGNDDYYTNNLPGNSNFKIVTERFNTIFGYMEVYSYDIGPGIGGDNISSWISLLPFAFNDHYAPTVAFGPINSQYMVTETAEDASIYPGNMMIMEPFDMADPSNIAWDPSGSFRYYFEVNNTGGTAAFTDAQITNHTNAVSTPCNYVSDTSLVAWADFDGGSGTYNIWYKRSGYDWLGAGYAYRTANSSVVMTEQNEIPELFPNPATDIVNVDAVGNYHVTNMLGQVLQTGTLYAGSHTIDVRQLPPGNYVMTLNADGRQPIYKRFSKN